MNIREGHLESGNADVKEENEQSDYKRKSKFRQKRENVKKGRLIIRNLSFKATEETLKAELEKFGETSELNLLKKADGKLVGCAFVQYQNYEDSIKAIKGLHGKNLLNRKVTVEFAVSKNRYQVQKTKPEEDEQEIKVEINEEGDEENSQNTKTKKTKKSKDPANASKNLSPLKKALEKEEDSEEFEAADDDDEDDDFGETDDSGVEDDEKPLPSIKQEKKYNDEDHDYTIFIKNISFETTNDDLRECFKKFGPIKYALIVKDPVSGHSKGTGFVRFLKKESVNLCLQQSGLIVLQNFTLEVFPSLPKQKIQSLEAEKTKKEVKDSRNLYLLREGMVLAGSSAAEGVSATDMSKRLRLEQIKSSMLKNLNRFISRDRLTIHNLPETFDDDKMRKMVIARTGVKPIECRVMREGKPTPDHPAGKSKGFGFLSFKKHEDALNALRKLNNNPDVFSANHRPIVSFSIEDKKVLNIKEKRVERSKQNNPTYQKKLEKIKARKAAKRAARKERKSKDVKEKKPVVAAQAETQEEEGETPEAFSGFAAKPGAFVKLRGTFRLKEQSKIHEKSMKDSNKKTRREKQMAEIRKEKVEKRQDRSKKRKIDEGTHDNLTKMIDKYKNLIKGNDGASESKRAKVRGKWFME